MIGMPVRISVYIWRENIISATGPMRSRPNQRASTSPASSTWRTGSMTSGVTPVPSSQSAT